MDLLKILDFTIHSEIECSAKLYTDSLTPKFFQSLCEVDNNFIYGRVEDLFLDFSRFSDMGLSTAAEIVQCVSAEAFDNSNTYFLYHIPCQQYILCNDKYYDNYITFSQDYDNANIIDMIDMAIFRQPSILNSLPSITTIIRNVIEEYCEELDIDDWELNSQIENYLQDIADSDASKLITDYKEIDAQITQMINDFKNKVNHN